MNIKLNFKSKSILKRRRVAVYVYDYYVLVISAKV